MHSNLRIIFLKLLANYIKNFAAASLRGIQFATKAQRHKVEKMRSIFSFCLQSFPEESGQGMAKKNCKAFFIIVY
jgi:hypothetical protein